MEGEHFQMLKFRSMVMDAEAKLAELHGKNEGQGLLFKIKDDPPNNAGGPHNSPVQSR